MVIKIYLSLHMVSQLLTSFLALESANKTKLFLCSQLDCFFLIAGQGLFHHFVGGKKLPLVLSYRMEVSISSSQSLRFRWKSFLKKKLIDTF